MKYEIGDVLTDESGHYQGVVCIKWNDGDLCTIENDAAHPNPRLVTSKSRCICGPFYLSQGTHNSICPLHK